MSLRCQFSKTQSSTKNGSSSKYLE